MNNHQITQTFMERFQDEIGIFIADLNLQDIHIRFSGKQTDTLRKYPSILAKPAVYWERDTKKRRYTIYFNWPVILGSTSPI
jgi:hypothetical protein